MNVGQIGTLYAQNSASGIDAASWLTRQTTRHVGDNGGALRGEGSRSEPTPPAEGEAEGVASTTRGAGGRLPPHDSSFAKMLDEALSAAAPGANNAPVVDKNDKLYEQCEALETFVLKILVSGMRKTVQKSELTSGGFAGEMYEDMLYDEYAKSFSKNAAFGLADMAYLELTGQRGKTVAASSEARTV